MPKRSFKSNKKAKVNHVIASSKAQKHQIGNSKRKKFESMRLKSKKQRDKHQSFIKRQNDSSLSVHQRIQELLTTSKKKKKGNKKKRQNKSKKTKTKHDGNSNNHNKNEKVLYGAQFRWMNEMLYNITGEEAMERMKDYKNEFIEYHAAYNDMEQNEWPQSPRQRIIRSITKKLAKISKKHKLKSSEYIVSDFGCGDAKIAKYFDTKYNKNTNIEMKVNVSSFDLISLNEYVTACDMSDVPLETESVDLVIFCLSLMGTNFHEYLIEAHRVLKPNGLLKIAEVRSRFYGINKFERFLNRTGFDVVAKDLMDNTQFVLFHCTKSKNKNCQKFPVNFDAQTILKPCAYKKR